MNTRNILQLNLTFVVILILGCTGHNPLQPDVSMNQIGLSTVAEINTQVPQTGQTVSYHPGDDGDLRKGASWPFPRFQKNSDGTITDTLTGLMWEVNGKKGFNWKDAIGYCKNLRLGGYSDWRMPNRNELLSLISYGLDIYTLSAAAWLNKQGFDISNSEYWTSTTKVFYRYPSIDPNIKFLETDQAWYVNMNYSFDEYYDTYFLGKGRTRYVIAVRTAYSKRILVPRTGQTTSYYPGDDGDIQAGAAWPKPRFKDNGNGTIIDYLTGLTWEKVPENKTYIWSDAFDRIKKLNTVERKGGYTDWRLPNIREMQSLINCGEMHNVAWLKNQGFGMPEGYYWSSTTAGEYGSGGDVKWYYYMKDGWPWGGFTFSGPQTDSRYVLAVRSWKLKIHPGN